MTVPPDTLAANPVTPTVPDGKAMVPSAFQVDPVRPYLWMVLTFGVVTFVSVAT